MIYWYREKIMANLVDKWDESYERLENNILYPKEEVVKFLNRYVIKKTSLGGDSEVLIDKVNKIKNKAWLKIVENYRDLCPYNKNNKIIKNVILQIIN